jgi:YD repeat-containing protein
MTRTTDPRGRSTYYQYDKMGRLQYVMDHDGHVLSENTYHYKNN